ncbi:hypothetical protein [Ruegeria atlantica]|uniref:alpha-glutamyl/putrescinyl thymine pyrophosphorylase clade 3 protein n=1 Tax=Ruegeria atlantica TaxID=81569 RepID=UPI001481158D|nr:hypothetical protein [Ruegeria atlantica]
MRAPAHRDKSNQLLASLANFEVTHGKLPGIVPQAARDTFVAQIISSLRRIDFVRRLSGAGISDRRLDPHDEFFDPIKGAALLLRKGEIDEAIWLTFVGTQFGKHVTDGWKLAANVMGSFSQGPVWTEAQYRNDRAGFDAMLENNAPALDDWKTAGRYSNHRQYESRKPKHLSKVFNSFSNWQNELGGFRERLQFVHQERGQNPEEAFDGLYKSFSTVHGFGRLGTFDFLTMVGKLELAPISPGSVYLRGATGPFAGAKFLFFGDREYSISATKLEPQVDELDNYLMVGKQVIEDSLCNWQKSPESFIYFKG